MTCSGWCQKRVQNVDPKGVKNGHFLITTFQKFPRKLAKSVKKWSKKGSFLTPKWPKMGSFLGHLLVRSTLEILRELAKSGSKKGPKMDPKMPKMTHFGSSEGSKMSEIDPFLISPLVRMTLEFSRELAKRGSKKWSKKRVQKWPKMAHFDWKSTPF